jgi:hypothetical protein
MLFSSDIKKDCFGRTIADNKTIVIHDYLIANEIVDDSLPTDRLQQHPIKLILRAIGKPSIIINKIVRLATTLFNTFYLPNQNKRLQRLLDIGFIEQIPSQKQLWFGAYDALRFFISPGAASYYQTKKINFTFHQILRFLNDPSGIADPVGIRVPRDTIICHLLEVVHANPVYDLQLLDQFDDGLAEMEKQTAQMLNKTHVRYNSIMAIVEDKDYHARLLDFVKKYRENPATKQMIRASGLARNNPDFLLAECTFGTLPASFRYFSRLPNNFSDLWKHAHNSNKINPTYCDAWIVDQLQEITL